MYFEKLIQSLRLYSHKHACSSNYIFVDFTFYNVRDYYAL